VEQYLEASLLPHNSHRSKSIPPETKNILNYFNNIIVPASDSRHDWVGLYGREGKLTELTNAVILAHCTIVADIPTP